MEPAEVAERIGLGRLHRPAEVLKHDEPFPVWRFSTDSGEWVVKATRPWGDFWLGVAAQAGVLEAAAWRAGVPVAEPLIPADCETGLWQPIGEGVYAQAVRFREGEHPDPPVASELAAWAGATVAAIERLDIEADPAVDADYTSHPESDWDTWLSQARDQGVLDAGQARALKDAAVRIDAIAAPAMAEKPRKLVMHRDFSHLNILVAADGPLLIDFGSAGPETPWWELMAVAIELASPGLGVMRPERRAVEACIEGYLGAGGTLGPTDETAFTGQLAGRLGSTAWQLWMSCGHRGGTPELHARHAVDLRASITALNEMLDAVPTWASWLRG